MKFLILASLIFTAQLHAFDLPVMGIGKSGQRHEAYEKMLSWCDKNNGTLNGYICRRVDSQVHCSYNTYMCSGICKIGEDALNEQALEGYQFSGSL